MSFFILAKLPSYTVLDNLMLRLDNLPQPRPWKEALNEYINSLQ